MKKLIKNIIYAITTLFFTANYAQVGINTTSPNAALDVVSTTNGMLLPRVALTTTTLASPVVNPAGGALPASTLVYNTNTAGDVTPGYYYWSGSAWLRLNTGSGGSGGGWLLTGNTVTNTDYIGTNSWHSFKMRAGNTQYGSIDPNGSVFFGVNASGSTNNAFVFGPRSQATASESFALGQDVISEGWQSFGIGTSARARSANSMAIGWGANTGNSGSASIAIGQNATTNANAATSIGRNSSASGDDSMSIGYNSNSTTSQSLALGASSVANGVGSTALGNSATSSGLYSTAIGYQATTSQARAIVLGNSADASVGVGIGTNSPNSKLHIVSSASSGFQYQDGNQGADKILTSDANGKATWASSVNGPVMLKGVYVPGSYANQAKHDFDLQLGSVNSDKTYFILSETVTSHPQAVTITGIQGGVDGRIITIVSHQPNFQINLQDSNTNSVVGNRINTLTFTGSGALQINNKGFVTLMYQISDQKWHVIDYRIGPP